MGHLILIIDDEEKIRSLLSRILKLEGFEVLEAPDLKTGLQMNAQHLPTLLLCDVKLPDGNGVAQIEALKKDNPNAEIIMLTAHGNIPDGVQAIKNGAFDYLTKGDDNNRIIPLINRALEKIKLAHKVAQLEAKVQKKYGFERIIGDSDVLKRAVQLAQKVAQTDTSVLLTGETGTGKEVFAQSIHQASQRGTQSFVAINCAAFSKEILESELFGHKAGAFTGALKDHIGLFEQAHQGTLFLDEIGEMPIELQAKLLRVLETGTFIKVGDTKTTQVNVRLIAATNRDLRTEITAKNFREDLFYRISVFQIELPSLQQRKEDIPLLTSFFVQKFAHHMGINQLKISPEYQKKLQEHTWKGNIRELKNAIERSVILAENHCLSADTLMLNINNSETQNTDLSLFEAEKTHIQKILAFHQGNKTKTAETLGIALTTLYRKMQEMGI